MVECIELINKAINEAAKLSLLSWLFHVFKSSHSLEACVHTTWCYQWKQTLFCYPTIQIVLVIWICIELKHNLKKYSHFSASIYYCSSAFLLYSAAAAALLNYCASMNVRTYSVTLLDTYYWTGCYTIVACLLLLIWILPIQ